MVEESAENESNRQTEPPNTVEEQEADQIWAGPPGSTFFSTILRVYIFFQRSVTWLFRLQLWREKWHRGRSPGEFLNGVNSIEGQKREPSMTNNNSEDWTNSESFESLLEGDRKTAGSSKPWEMMWAVWRGGSGARIVKPITVRIFNLWSAIVVTVQRRWNPRYSRSYRTPLSLLWKCVKRTPLPRYALLMTSLPV